MASTGFQAAPGWRWPDEAAQPTDESSASASAATEETPHRNSSMPGWYDPADEHPPVADPPSAEDEAGSRSEEPGHQKHYRPRQCRICLDTVLPTFHPPTEHLPRMFRSAPHVTYESEEGPLIRPCKCRGSARYVHEGCLEAWRHADPSYGRRNFWQCPTCGFRYRLERMTWGRLISGTAAQVGLTLAVFLLATFVLGFIADPIINFYLNPYGSFLPLDDADDYVAPVEGLPEGWSFHFVKGFATLGLMSFLRLFPTNPLRFFALRSRGGATVRVGNTGRDRLGNVTWLVILIGIATFLYGVWKTVRAWSRRLLKKAGQRVMDVQGHDSDDEDDDEPLPANNQ
ncbi:uncharacterized protein K452DRAFT_357610 [Aplosporella prunicola CBS 121167]|uniref:RING-CH-type domain-containing protein n=1 Tax=Aplosporella prunicola CBS 121167 TaxID=1176127 RepID=A0A6A6BIX8_9PEZI|nr:uncharacterized protein K452DRAFT_357610 [Aplosporella prunicola CBS 121167]KAF2143255.1 hypothetical protein K452DRAFT_357610 [Aplosporella prunicola CBS 121167]